MPDLQEYIHEELKKGFTRDQITQTLLKYKYPQNTIDQAFEKVSLDKDIKKKEHIFNWGEIVFVVGAIVLLTFGGLWWQYSSKEIKITPKVTQQSSVVIQQFSSNNERNKCYSSPDKSNCFTELAVKYTNASFCGTNPECLAEMSIRTNTSELCMNNECILELAKKTNNKELCQKTDVELECELKLINNKEEQLTYLQKHSSSIGKNGWYVYATMANNSEVCTIAPEEKIEELELKNSNAKELCTLEWAFHKHDLYHCDLLTNPNDVLFCKELVTNGCKDYTQGICYVLG